MSMTALADTKIPHMYSTGLYNEKGFDVAWEHTHKVLDVMVNGITQALSDIKSKDYPVAFVLKEKNDEFVVACLVQYFPNEDDETKPGNWNYSWTFYESDLPEKTRIMNIEESNYLGYFRTYGHTKWGMVFEDSAYPAILFKYLMVVIRNWLDNNASETEERGVKLDGVIQFRVAVENGEKIFAAELDGEIKQMIKSDAAIEV